MKLAAKLWMLTEEMGFAEKLSVFESVGLDGVEIATPDPAMTHELLRAAFSASPVALATIIVGDSFTYSIASPDVDERARVKRAVVEALQLASDLGVSAIMMSPGYPLRSSSLTAQMQQLQTDLSELGELALRLGPKIGLENLWNGWYHSGSELAGLVDALGAHAFGVHLDTGNAARFGFVEHFIDALNTRIIRIDVKNFDRNLSGQIAPNKDSAPAIAQIWDPGPWGSVDQELLIGNIDWSLVGARLRLIGYSGWLCAELRGGSRERLARIADDLRTVRDICDQAVEYSKPAGF